MPKGEGEQIAATKQGPYVGRMVDAFCGAGGISDGAALEGWEVVGIDVVNHPKYRHPLIHKDIREVTIEDVGPVDWFHGSPPCQRFSTARASRVRDPPTEADLDLLQAALRLRDQLEPRYWSIENVAGAVPLFSKLLGPPVLNNGAFRFWGNFPPFLMPTSRPHRKGFQEPAKTGKRSMRWIGKHRSPWLRAYVPASISRPLAAACRGA